MGHLKTMILCLSGAIIFGVLHDLITANLCVEYFTIGHPKVIESENSFLLALVWGIIATWWVGFILGVLLILFNVIGKRPEVPFAQIKRYVLRLLLIMPLTSLIAGVIGYFLAKSNSIYLLGELAEMIPSEKEAAFLAVGCAHVSSYFVGLIGGVVICMNIWMLRKKLSSGAK